MAIYLRSRPDTGAKTLRSLSLLATIGIAALYPFFLFGAAWTLGKVDEVMMADPGEPDRAVTPASNLISMMTAYTFSLTASCFGTVTSFKGTDQWISPSATLPHRDVAKARFLHISQKPGRRAVGTAWAVLATALLVASPIALMAIPRTLIYIGLYSELDIESPQELVDEATSVLLLLHIALFVALVRAAVRRRSSAVRLKPQGMAVTDLSSFTLPLPSSRDELGVQEAPARWGRIKVQAVYLPPSKGAKPGAPVLIPRLSLTVKPSKVDDARSQVEAQLDEVWRAVELVRTPDDPAPQVPSPSESAKTSTEDHDSARDSDAGSEPPGTFRA